MYHDYGKIKLWFDVEERYKTISRGAETTADGCGLM